MGRKPSRKANALRAELHEAALASMGLKRIDSPHDPATVERLAARLSENRPKEIEFTLDEALRNPKLAAIVWRTARHALAAGRALPPALQHAFVTVLRRVETDPAFYRQVMKALQKELEPIDIVEQAALCADLLDVGPLLPGESRQDRIAQAFGVASRTLQRKRARVRGPGKPGRPAKKSDR